MSEQLQTVEEIIEGLARPERFASIIAEYPQKDIDELASMVEGEQVPGSFGDLIKRSIEIIRQHEKFSGDNVVSIFKR